MQDTPTLQHDRTFEPDARSQTGLSRHNPSTSLRWLWEVLARRRRMIASVVGGLLLLCLLYCLIAPNQYEASAKVALRTSPASSLSLDAAEPPLLASILSAAVATGDAGQRLSQRPTGLEGD